jgi:hypothetical protein
MIAHVLGISLFEVEGPNGPLKVPLIFLTALFAFPFFCI